MKHWANTYVFDHASSTTSRHGDSTTFRSDKQLGPQHPPAAESRHESSHHNNSAHWSSIVDPYSAHGPAISVHDGKLCTFPTSTTRSSDVSNISADLDPIRPPPRLPQQTNQPASTTFMPNYQSMPPDVTSIDGSISTDGRIPPDARIWYGQQKKSDWYGVTLRTNNKTPMQMLGYQSEQDLDDCSDQCSDINQKKSSRVSSDDCDKDSGIGVALNVPNAASLNTTVAHPNKQIRNGDST